MGSTPPDIPPSRSAYDLMRTPFFADKIRANRIGEESMSIDCFNMENAGKAHSRQWSVKRVRAAAKSAARARRPGS